MFSAITAVVFEAGNPNCRSLFSVEVSSGENNVDDSEFIHMARVDNRRGDSEGTRRACVGECSKPAM